MIDTVCLLIPKDKLIVLEMSSYGVPTWNLHSKTDQYDKYVKNPSKRDKDSGLYFPRLTGYKRKGFAQDANVRIEFSVPKCILARQQTGMGRIGVGFRSFNGFPFIHNAGNV